jgi:malate synthase
VNSWNVTTAVASADAPPVDGANRVLTPEACAFVADLGLRFGPRLRALLGARRDRQARLDAGEPLDFLSATAGIRAAEWRIAPPPAPLQDRRVEITGPVDRKMVINGLNSGAQMFMADFEDATAPTWRNVIAGQLNLMDAVRRTITHKSPEGKEYTLQPSTAVLLVRPRGLHLPEAHMLVDCEPVPACLFDFGLFLCHNAHEQLRSGAGPYLYLPKLQGHLEARWWNDVFVYAERILDLPAGSIRAYQSGSRPREGLNPNRPQYAAGMRMLPPPSEPWAIGTMPDATAAADPPLEPPASRSGA